MTARNFLILSILIALNLLPSINQAQILDTKTVTVYITIPKKASITLSQKDDDIAFNTILAITQSVVTFNSEHDEPSFYSGFIPFTIVNNTPVELTISSINGFMKNNTSLSQGVNRIMVGLEGYKKQEKTITKNLDPGQHVFNTWLRHYLPEGETSTSRIRAGLYQAQILITVTPTIT